MHYYYYVFSQHFHLPLLEKLLFFIMDMLLMPLVKFIDYLRCGLKLSNRYLAELLRAFCPTN